jgi:hypothetical protein
VAFERFLAEADLGSDRTARRDRVDLINREGALGEHVQHFTAHVPRGADNSDIVAHIQKPLFRALTGKALRVCRQLRNHGFVIGSIAGAYVRAVKRHAVAKLAGSDRC